LSDWKTAGLNVETAIKRGVYTIKESLIRKKVGILLNTDAENLENSIRVWFGL
jgi:mRNA interferase MazF